MVGAYLRIKDPRVIIIVRPGKTNEFIICWSAGLVSAHAQLRTGGVELCTTFLGGEVEGDDFVSDEPEVVPGFEG